MIIQRLLPLAALCAAAALAADQPAPSVGKILDQSLSGIEHEIVPLVEAVPAEKFTFAPKDGEFSGVRTFAQQAKHVAYVNYVVSAAVLGEKNPTTSGPAENGPDNIQSKDDVVKYLKDSFAYAHRAMQTVTGDNATGMIENPFGGKNKMPRLGAANVAIWHSFDHYGQMVVYARMNGVVPPASRQ